MKQKVRVRFAPSPTGMMHVGNIRAALMNYLFARQKKGTFVLRIEDTDVQRNVKQAQKKIFDDLRWLGLSCDEGPGIGGEYGPYIQSERLNLYHEKLHDLVGHNKAYRCFCSKETLEQKRELQRAAGKPPRYDRACANLSDDKVQRKVAAGLPFIWRVRVNDQQILDVHDMSRGTISFEMKNFQDFAITRQDGSYTFLFTNFVDDWLMEISHVIRGEDHLSNTALQAALYDALMVPIPVFWHLPIICNQEGTKLSKRDFGFSLQDLRAEGFLPQAICNYLTIIGGSFEQEVQSNHEFSKDFDFENVPKGGSIKYDFEKLCWVNQQWIKKLSGHELVQAAKPFVNDAFPESKDLDDQKIEQLVQLVAPEIKTFKDVESLLRFYFFEPDFDSDFFVTTFGQEKTEIIKKLISENAGLLEKPDEFLNAFKKQGKASGLSMKDIFSSLRYLLTGKLSGIGVKDVLEILERKVVDQRLRPGARP